MLASVIRNAAANSAATLSRLVVGFFFTPVFIRLLGTDAYGVWSFVSVFSLNGYLTLLTLGIQGTLIRDLSKAITLGDAIGFRRLLSSGFCVYSAAGVVGAMVMIALGALVGTLFNIPEALVGTARALFLLLAIQTLVDFPALALDGAIEAYQRYGVRSLVESGRFGAFALSAVLLLRSGADTVVLGQIALLLSLASFSTVFMILRLGHGQMLSPVLPSLSEIGRLLRESTSLFVIRLNAVVFQQMDRTILARLMSTSAITHYDIGARIYGFALISQSMTASVILPTASSRVALGDQHELRRLFMSMTRLTSVLATPTALGLLILAEPFVRAWIGPDYASDAIYARLFLFMAAFWTFTHVGYNVMIALGRLGQLARISVWTTLLNLVLSIGLTLRFGIAGVILGTIIGNAVAAALYLRLYLGALEVPLVRFAVDVVARSTLPAIAAAVTLLIAVATMPPITLVQVGGYFVAYFALAIVMYLAVAADPDERRYFIRLAKWPLRSRP